MRPLTNRFSLIKEAYQDIVKGRFAEAIVILEKVMASGINDAYLVFLLAISYLFLDKFKEANIQIERLKNMDSDYPPLVQLETFLKVKSSKNFEAALNMYLDLIERYPQDPYLYRGRKLISYADDFTLFQRDAKLSDFVGLPKPPSHLKKIDHGKKKVKQKDVIRHVVVNKKKRQRGFSFNVKTPVLPPVLYYFKKSVKTLILLIPVLLVSAGGYYYFSDIKSFISRSLRPDPDIDYSQVDLINVAGSELDIVKKNNAQKYPEFYYSINEITRDFNESKQLIKKAEYNEAVILLNKIKYSNASFIVKEKVDFLLKFIRGIETRTYETIPYAELIKKAYLYRGCAVHFKGRVANYKSVNKKARFNILIDYKNHDIFTGMAEVFSEQQYNIKNGDLVKLDALFINTIGENNRVYLVADNIENQ